MGRIILNGNQYGGGGGGGSADIVEVTLAEYIALGDVVNTDGKLYCITDLNNSDVQGYPPLIYSDEEREIGVWRDGKPLYQKTWDISDLTISYNSWTISSIPIGSMETIVNVLAINQSGKAFWGDAMASIEVDPTYIGFQTGRNGNNTERYRYITIQYTKTTDVAGSGIWNGQGGLAHHYSTSEKVIGTWIDGKPLYEKTFNLTSGITIGGYTNIALDTTTNKIKNLDGYIERSNGAIDKINGYIQSDDTTRMAIRTGKIEVYISSVFTGVSELCVTVQYTKTTD